jgi:hypothetical protein
MHEEIPTKIGKSPSENIILFLTDLGFIKNKELTDLGSEYFKYKFIFNDDDASNKILTNIIKEYDPTQAICQVLWGRPKLKRMNVYKLLVHQEYINSSYFKEDELGSFLMLLNKCDILKYNKKNNDINIIFNPRTGSSKELVTRFLTPELAYSNLRNLWEVLRNCKNYIHWFDKHFSPKGIESLIDEADGTKINEIKILTGIGSTNLEKLRRDFIRFESEIKLRHINSEIRVIFDKNLLNDIHDRWIISQNDCYNVPPVNSIYMGQYSEIVKTSNRPPFNDWWDKGLDIVNNWNELTKYL